MNFIRYMSANNCRNIEQKSNGGRANGKTVEWDRDKDVMQCHKCAVSFSISRRRVSNLQANIRIFYWGLSLSLPK